MNSFLMWLASPILWLANRWDWLGVRINKLFINSLINVCRTRPHPWSTISDYVSWASLTEQRWSARLLPAKKIPDPPPYEKVIAIFDRRAGEQRFCQKSSVLFPAFAQYLTDGFIRTMMKHDGDTDDVLKQNTSNHQIDLSPLYGRTIEQTRALRLLSNAPGEKGRLKSQTIGGEEYAHFLKDAAGATKPEFACLDEPLGLSSKKDPGLIQSLFAFGGDRANAAPQVSMINTLFLREHNRLAGEIERANPDWDDEQIFQTTRNAIIVIFLRIVIEDYINHITPSSFRFRADAAVAWKAAWNRPNWITAEFSLLYRWHSLVPDMVRWNGRETPIGDTILDNRLLLEAGLGRAFVDISAQRAGALGAFNTPEALWRVEEKAIHQGRVCDIAPYADYRECARMGKPGSFRAITKNKAAAAMLKDLYGEVDRVEFYVGLFAEEPVKNSPLPPLILRLVAMDAFSQALTNPLLSEHVYKEETFSPVGWKAINDTRCLRDLLKRNATLPEDARISMTREGWRPRWF